MSQRNDPIHILLVEDNPGDRKLIQKRLDKDTTDVWVLSTTDNLGDALIHLSKTADLDAILLDLSLPDSIGLDTLRRTVTAAPSVPIVILTGLDDESMAGTALRCGAQDYLLKDEIDTITLVRSIHYAIERKHGEDQKNKLIHTDRLVAIGQLAASVAHEINNPADYIMGNLCLMEEALSQLATSIASIRQTVHDRFGTQGAAIVDDILSDGAETSVFADMREMIRDNIVGVERIHSIVRDLSSFSRVDREEIEWVQLNDVLEAAFKLTSSHLRHRAQVSKQFGELPTIAGDRSKLTQVFVNLLVNAAHAIQEGSSETNLVRIESRRDAKHIRIEIEDSGIGMSQETLRRLFEPFFTTKERGVGTGLGLSLCAEIIQFHSGDINVSSEWRKGTCFEVTLPLDTCLPVTKMTKPVSVNTDERLHRTRILVIDDDPLVRKGLERRLRRDHDVTEVSNGRSALDLLSTSDGFDVILCDLMMPDMDGPRLYEQLSEKAPHLCHRLIFVSGGAVTQRTKDFVSSGHAPVLQKPVSNQTLQDAIRRVVVADQIETE